MILTECSDTNFQVTVTYEDDTKFKTKMPDNLTEKQIRKFYEVGTYRKYGLSPFCVLLKIKKVDIEKERLDL